MTGFTKSFVVFVSLPSFGFFGFLRFSGLLCHWHVILVKKMHRGRQEKRTSKDKKSSKAKGSKADSKESGSLGSKDFGSFEAKPHDGHMLPAEGQAENKKQGHSFFTRYRWYRWYRCPTANSESTKCTNIGRVHHAQPSSELTTVVRSCSSLMFDLGHLHGGNSQFFKTTFFSLDFTLMNPNYAMIARTISMCHDYCQLLVRIWG
jgi:hypothetical protein